MSYVDFLRTNRTWLFAGFLLSFASSWGQTFYISLFAGQIMQDFGLTDGQWGGIYTIGTTASAIAMVWVGTLTDRFMVRQIGAATLVALALACLAMAALPASAGWALILVIFALRLTGQGMLSHIAIVAMARWFVATRGRAISIASMGFAAGQALLPIAVVALLLHLDWRTIWAASAGLVLLAIPLARALLSRERTPQSIAADKQVSGMNGQHWTRAQALRHPLFWLMVPALLGPPAWGTALFFHQVHLVETKGWVMPAWVALMPAFTLVAVVATFASGWLIDRFGAGRMVPFYLLPFAAGFLLLAQAGSTAAAFPALALIGIGMGMQATLPGVFWAEYYGTRHLGAIKSAAAAIMVFGSAIGPGLSGWLIDAGFDFPAQMPALALYFIVAGLVASLGVLRARTALSLAA
jgi:MFS family permease